MCIFAHFSIVLHCHDVIIFLGRKIAHVENNGLGKWLNANWNGQSVIQIFRINMSELKLVIGDAPQRYKSIFYSFL